jgi:hypothetical protein
MAGVRQLFGYGNRRCITCPHLLGIFVVPPETAGSSTPGRSARKGRRPHGDGDTHADSLSHSTAYGQNLLDELPTELAQVGAATTSAFRGTADGRQLTHVMCC